MIRTVSILFFLCSTLSIGGSLILLGEIPEEQGQNPAGVLSQNFGVGRNCVTAYGAMA